VRAQPVPEEQGVDGGGPAVTARAMVLAYGPRVALAASDLSLPAGRVAALIGPNGSGKSTLLNAIAGLIRPAAGSIEVLGGPPAAVRRQVAYVLQSTRVNEAMPVTVREVVTMGRYGARRFFGRLQDPDREAVDRALERLGIADLAARQLGELSGGQRQRAFVAQGLAQDGDLLLLDESLTGLDLPSRERILSVVDEETVRGKTVILTTHDLSEAADADFVVLCGGRVVAAGPPADVLTQEHLAAAYGGFFAAVAAARALGHGHLPDSGHHE
jgi:iron complex transport system ATP-binding protein